MKNQSSIASMAIRYRKIPVVWKVVGFISIFTPLLSGICGALWGVISGVPFLSVIVLLGFLMVYTPKKKDLEQLCPRPDSCPFAASETGIAFPAADLTMKWPQIRNWVPTEEGVAVTLDHSPFDLPDTLETKVLVHEDGISCVLRPDSPQDSALLIQLLQAHGPHLEGEKQ